MDLWWKPWKEQGVISILAYDHLKETKRHANLEAEPCTVDQEILGRPGETDQEIGIDEWTLVLLVPADKVELTRIANNYNIGPPEAC